MRKLLLILLAAVLIVLPLQMSVDGATSAFAQLVQIDWAEAQATEYWAHCCLEGSWGCCVMWFFDELFNDF